MKRRIIMLVLILLVIKTNAQNAQFYYYNGEKINLNFSKDKILIRLINDDESRNKLLSKINNNPNFKLLSPALDIFKGEYFLLQLSNNSIYSTDEAIQLFTTESYTLSASLAFEQDGDVEAIANDIYVKPKATTSAGDLENALSQYGYSTKEENMDLKGIYNVYFPKTSIMNTLQIANALYESGLFEFAEPDFFVYYKQSCATTDPQYSNQWGLQNTGQFGGTPGMDINACGAWNITTGTSGIKIAIIDNGVDLTHPDLSVSTGFDATGGGSGGGPNPTDAHGTHCAGIAAAKQNNGIGISGVAPSCTIVPVRFATGSFALSTSNTMIVNSINFAAANADVMSCSWRVPPAGVIDAAISSAYYTGRGGLGCLIVVAAGNDNSSTISYPASNPLVLSVGAMNMCGERKQPGTCDGEGWGSNFGPTLGIVAPGVHLWSTDIQGASGDDPGDYFEFMNGTSGATPHIAGVAGLILSADPCINVAELKALMEFTADKVGSTPYVPVTGYSGYPITYRNDQMGFGKVNAGNAVVLAHDVYRQNEFINTLPESYVSSSVHKLYSGSHVSTIKPTGYYTVGAGGIIGFKAPESIELDPGFMADNGSLFTATIDGPCTTGYLHWRESNTNDLHNTSAQPVDALKENIYIYPNPAHDLLNISYLLVGNEDVRIDVINALGQKIQENNYPDKESGKQLRTLNIKNLVPGNYFIIFKMGDETHQFKFVKD